MTHLPAWDIRVALEQFPSSKASYIPSAMWSVIHEAVVKQCDALDGVMDGLVSDPSRYIYVSFPPIPTTFLLSTNDRRNKSTVLTKHRCNFHPEVLACGRAGINSSTCLNPAQIANLHRIYTPWWEANNTLIYPGLSPGGEAGFGFLFNGATPQFGSSLPFRRFPLSFTIPSILSWDPKSH
jgi:feruloyl esterase